MDKAPRSLQALAWVALRRAGYDVTWDQAGDVAAISLTTRTGPYADRQLDQLLHFCRFWNMHPREVDQLYPDEYQAMITYAVRVQRDERARDAQGREARAMS